MRQERTVPDGWERLVCTCGHERFATVTHLRWRAGAGVTAEPAGYFCLECHAIVDSGALIAKAQLKAKRQELLDLEAQMSEEMPLVKTPMAAASGKKGV